MSPRVARLLVLLALAPGCLPVDPPDGALRCAAAPNACPPGYECRADNACWRVSTPVMTTSDMATISASTDLSSGPTCAAGQLFCDDFESGGLGRWGARFLEPDMGTSLTVDTALAHGGSHALHGIAGMAGASSWAYAIHQWAGNTEPLALRLWVMPVKPLQSYGMVTRLLHGTLGFQIGGDNNGLWMVAQDLGAGAEYHSTVHTPLNAWSCVELVVAGGRAQLFLDDGATPALDFMVQSPTTYDELHAGVEWSPSGVPVDSWVDDVALGTTRLHCQ